MRAEFQIVRSGLVIFKHIVEDATYDTLGRHSFAALEGFILDQPSLNLADDNITMRWAALERV